MKPIQFSNGVSIELLARGDEFLGLGEVTAGETALRSARRPMFAHIRTPDGVELSNYRLEHRDGTPERVLLEFSADAQSGGLMEWMVHEVRPRINTADWTAPPRPAEETRLQLELQPVTREIGSEAFHGFSYQYRYRSKPYPIYKLMDRGTWEIGGSCLGSEFWMRNCFVPPIARFENEEQFYSTEWYIPDCANPSAFQFLPLQTELQGYTFTASEQGVLVTWAREVAHVRSLFEKPRQSELLVHFHEHCADLSHDFATAPVEVLFSAGARDRVQRFNAHDAVRELVHRTLHDEIDMKRERVMTYGQIEEWGPPDVSLYTREGVPKLTGVGCKTIYLANHFQNNMNTWDVSNFCCTVDLKVSEVSGKEKLTELCHAAQQGGARIEMWGNTAISSLTKILDNERGRRGTGQNAQRAQPLPREGSIMEALDAAEAPFVRNASNAIEADHYTPVFCALNLRDPAVRDYWLRSWQAAHDEVGLGGIFLDSSFNLSSDKFHWVQNTRSHLGGATADNLDLLGKHRPEEEPPAAILSQYHAHLSLMCEMQRLGYVYCNEDLGVFGVHRHGPDITARLDNLPLWSDCIATFDRHAIESAGADADDVFFRGLAYRSMWFLHWDIGGNRLTWTLDGAGDPPTARQLQLLQAFNELQGHMLERTILPGETGVLYRDGKRQVLWAFSNGSLPLTQCSCVRDVISGEEFPATAIEMQRHHVYLVTTG